jgi:hypothetical protein
MRRGWLFDLRFAIQSWSSHTEGMMEEACRTKCLAEPAKGKKEQPHDKGETSITTRTHIRPEKEEAAARQRKLVLF